MPFKAYQMGMEELSTGLRCVWGLENADVRLRPLSISW